MTKTQQQQTRYTFKGALLVNILTKDAAAAARPRLPSQLSSGGKQALHFAKMQSEKLLGFLGSKAAWGLKLYLGKQKESKH